MDIKDNLWLAMIYGDEENPPIVPRMVKPEAQEKWEQAKEKVKQMEDNGWLEIITIEELTRETMEICIRWLSQDDDIDAKELSDFVRLFDKVGIGGDDYWIFGIDVYR